MARRITTEILENEKDVVNFMENDLNANKEAAFDMKNVKHAILEKECQVCGKPYKSGVNVGDYKTCGKNSCMLKAGKMQKSGIK